MIDDGSMTMIMIMIDEDDEDGIDLTICCLRSFAFNMFQDFLMFVDARLGLWRRSDLTRCRKRHGCPAGAYAVSRVSHLKPTTYSYVFNSCIIGCLELAFSLFHLASDNIKRIKSRHAPLANS